MLISSSSSLPYAVCFGQHRCLVLWSVVCIVPFLWIFVLFCFFLFFLVRITPLTHTGRPLTARLVILTSYNSGNTLPSSDNDQGALQPQCQGGLFSLQSCSTSTVIGMERPERLVEIPFWATAHLQVVFVYPPVFPSTQCVHARIFTASNNFCFVRGGLSIGFSNCSN